MSIPPLPTLTTGLPEIDQEHAFLLDLLTQLDTVCALTPNPDAACADCTQAQRLSCELVLVSILSKALCFTVDHFTFEEKTMRWLPQSPERSAHCGAHIDDHEKISRELRDIALSIESSDIIRSGVELQEVIRRWLDEHVLNFDIPLVELLQSKN
ncbi:MAG: hypothetical protein A2045_04395 [Rhodocyclales bacterium GWA2_65_20]|nr:MAG: hypothetical protein A2045_04395 [Rhodocyclales bacterium GWA2_65_20]